MTDYSIATQLASMRHQNATCTCGQPAKIAMSEQRYKCVACYETEHAYKHIDSLRTESKGATRILYHIGFWDGPLSGIMLWNGEKAYFKATEELVCDGAEIITDEELEREKKEFSDLGLKLELTDVQELMVYRPFDVFRIPIEDMAAIDDDHKRFQEFVGTHTDYNEEGKRGRGAKLDGTDMGDLKPNNEHSKYYDGKKECKGLNLDTCEKIGQFRI